MKNDVNFSEARFSLAHESNQAIADGLKQLLESKHLYQNVVVDFPSLYDKFAKQKLLDNERLFLHKFALGEFSANFIPSEHEEYCFDQGVKKYPVPTLLVQNVKLFCSHCKERETFSPTLYLDATEMVRERHRGNPRTAAHPPGLQLFLLVFQCETCKTIPVGFLVKRVGWKLTLEGRTPFESVEMPKFIPKTEQWLFSGAIVAAQTGNTLAGLFYLRSFIEQFARRQTAINDRKTGDEILEAYQSLLSEKHREHMPSLRSWYEKLSIPIHAAKRDIATFEEARAAIVEHFDFRRLYKIPELNGPKVEPANKVAPSE